MLDFKPIRLLVLCSVGSVVSGDTQYRASDGVSSSDRSRIQHAIAAVRRCARWCAVQTTCREAASNSNGTCERLVDDGHTEVTLGSINIGYVLSLSVDDEVTVYLRGEVLHDTFSIPGSQSDITYRVTVHADVLVLKKWNVDGPGGVTVSVNGMPVSDWRCVTFGADQDPETEYPGSTYPNYDDSAWTEPINTMTWYYGQLCRAKLTI